MCERDRQKYYFGLVKTKIGVKVCIKMKDVIQRAINSTVKTLIQEMTVIIQNEMLFLHFNENDL